MELILMLLGLPIIILVWLIITSKGECYYCGHKFERGDIVFKKKDKAKVVKCCGDCRSSF